MIRTWPVFLAASKPPDPDWWVDHSTLLISLTSVVVSGLLGPTVIALWTAKRERDRDARDAVVSRRDDLRELLDETARTLAVAATHLRRVVAAQQDGAPPPDDQVEFLSKLAPFRLRLQLRLPDDHPILTAYEAVVTALTELENSTKSKLVWAAALDDFESKRKAYLQAGRAAVQAPIREELEI